ncbi:MAG: tol-pal system protein YbgF [Rhodobacteraceae bacterium]|nr:tol-pal system protein YbgF [Paracoccaceae bacterium]
MRWAVLALSLGIPAAAEAQQQPLLRSLPQGQGADAQTLADIRQRLALVYLDVRRLQRELSTTTLPQGGIAGSTLIDRVNALEKELQNLTARAEQIEYRIDDLVREGSRRIGDLAFRLCELEEGCDISVENFDVYLGSALPGAGEERPPIGINTRVLPESPELPAVLPPPATAEPSAAGEMAIGEEQDFQAATDALVARDFITADRAFAAFVETYPGSPLEGEAYLRRGQALEEQGIFVEAARSYLEAYSGDPTGPIAPEALYRLGVALGTLEQGAEACSTLAEVGRRHPYSPFVERAQARMGQLNCP